MTNSQSHKASPKELQEELDTQRRKVDVDHFDISIRELVRMSDEEELKIAPEYQRKFRWAKRNEARLIESILLGLPVPSLFVAANLDGTWELVDGLQRLSTLIHFLAENSGALSKLEQSSPLVLEELETLKSFNGYSFSDLPTPIKLLFTKRPLRVTVLSDKSDYNARFELFERLNSGGIALSEQEVRACIYRGNFTELLRELANHPEFLSLIKLQPGKRNDGTREEVVLKFFAYLEARAEFDGNVRSFLNEYIKKAVNDFDLDKGRKIFVEAVTAVHRITKGPVIRKGYGNTPLNQLEAILVGAAEILRSNGEIKQSSKDWLNDTELVRFSTKGTNTPSMLKGRVERARKLLEAKQ